MVGLITKLCLPLWQIPAGVAFHSQRETSSESCRELYLFFICDNVAERAVLPLVCGNVENTKIVDFIHAANSSEPEI